MFGYRVDTKVAFRTIEEFILSNRDWINKVGCCFPSMLSHVLLMQFDTALVAGASRG